MFKTWDEAYLHTKLMGMHFTNHSNLRYLLYQTEDHHSHFDNQFQQSSWKFYNRVLHNDCLCHTCSIIFQKQGIPLVCVLIHIYHTWAYRHHSPHYLTTSSEFMNSHCLTNSLIYTWNLTNFLFRCSHWMWFLSCSMHESYYTEV